jgi:hypothetical protein
MRKYFYVNVIVMSALLFLAACTKSESNKNAELQVMLTDAPADYDAVLIDIQDVQIHVSENDAEGSWQSLEVNKGVYNLLDFRNGMDTLLAAMELPAGTISQLRLVLGPNNQIETGGELHNLDTPSAQQSGLKLNINATLTGGIVYKLWIDFDAARSIVHKGNGGYSLKPVIRTFNEAVSGAISGSVSPAEALPYVMAISAGDTLGAYAADNGSFIIKAVPAGTWNVKFDPKDPFADTTVNDISVVNGIVTRMDTVFFVQP